MSLDVKIHTGISSQDYLDSFTASYYRGKEPSIDLQNEKEKKKWKKIFNLSDKQFDEAIQKFGNKLRDLRLGLRGPE